MKKQGMIKSINQTLLYMFGLLIFTFISCEDKNKDSVPSYDPNKPVELSDFSPTTGNIRKPVILRGGNFGNDAKQVKVYFNNHRAYVVTAKNDRMFVITPKCTYEDICTISVVIGKDSVTYPIDYNYTTISTVSTIVGGSKTAKEPIKETTTLALAQFDKDVHGICIDKYDNIFLANDKYVYKISEGDNTVKQLVDVSDYVFGGIIYTVTTDAKKEVIYSGLSFFALHYFIFDPTNEYKAIGRDVIVGSVPIDGLFKHGMAACTLDGFIYVKVSTSNTFYKFNPKTFKATVLAQGSQFPFKGESFGFAFHPFHPELLYMSSSDLHAIYSYNIYTNQFAVVAGKVGESGYWNAEANQAMLNTPMGIAFDSQGDLYIADKGNNCIRKLDYKTNAVSKVAGNFEASGYQDGMAEEALFDSPKGIAINSEDAIYISDEKNRAIRRLAIE